MGVASFLQASGRAVVTARSPAHDVGNDVRCRRFGCVRKDMRVPRVDGWRRRNSSVCLSKSENQFRRTVIIRLRESY